MSTREQDDQQRKAVRLIEQARVARHEKVMGVRPPDEPDRDLNYFLSYPRSGSHWIKARMRLILRKHYRYSHLMEPNRHLRWTHFGYAPSKNRDSSDRFSLERAPVDRFSIDHGSSIVVLLRDAKAVISSFYLFMVNRFEREHPDEVEFSRDPDEFSLSYFGVSRYCDFLNDIDTLKQMATKNEWKLKYIFYEDLFNLRSVCRLPGIMKIDLDIVPAAALGTFVRTNTLTSVSQKEDEGTSSDKETQIDKYKKTLSPETAIKIDDYMRQHCQLSQYQERYL